MKQLGAAALGLTSLTSLVALSALAAPPAQSANDERRATAIVTYTGGAVTVGEVEDTIANSSPLIQATALEPQELRGFVDRNLRFELQLKEAERLGYREDPRVRKAVKDNSVQLMISRDVNAPLRADPAPPDVLQKYFEAHREVFSLQELRRATALFVASEAEARALVPQVKAAADDAALGQLVQARGLEVPSKIRRGDLGRFTITGKPESGEEWIDPRVAKATFALSGIGAVSDPIRLDGSFVVLKMTEQRPGYVPSFEEVKLRVSRRYDDERYEKALNTMADSQRAQLHPIVRAELLDSVRFE